MTGVLLPKKEKRLPKAISEAEVGRLLSPPDEMVAASALLCAIKRFWRPSTPAGFEPLSRYRHDWRI